ncbi:MAG: S8 family peptidase [Actinomycetia bacterium]|nr:S8 family peptidase [Actinomycetes bacterium]
MEMRRRIYAILAVLAVFAALLTGGVAEAGELETTEPGDAKIIEESDTGSYIVVLEDEPVVAEVGADNLGSAEAEALSEEMEDSHDEVMSAAGVSTDDKVQDFTIALNGFSATMSHDEAVAVAAQSKVRLVIPDELHQVTTDSSREFLGLTKGGGAYKSGMTGEGVVVGVIDTGIWPEHPSFADTGYSAPPIVLEDIPGHPACEFGNTAHHPDDAPFSCNNKLIGARQMLGTYRALIGADGTEFDSARDDNGHGTHTASTAAGNDKVKAFIFGENVGKIGGIAPRAHIVAYKGLGELGGFTSDLVSAIDQAVADGVDVINYSVGGGPGLTSPDAISMLFATAAGVHIATSAGNAGPGPSTLGGPGDAPWLTTVGASTQERFFEGRLKLGNGSEYVGASVTQPLDTKTPMVDAADAGGDLCLPDTLDPNMVAGKIVLCRRGAIARVAKSLSVYEAGGVGMVLYNNTDDDDLHTDAHWVPSVILDFTPGSAVKSYIAKAGSKAKAKIEGPEVEDHENAPNMASFSSRGPNPSSSDVIKPDITAPGVQIVAGGSPFVDVGSVPGELFQAIAGTSMSSPHVAGMYALLAQAHPDWTPAMAKSAIMTSSSQDVRDNDRVSQAGPFAMGSGHLDPGKVKKKGSAFRPGLVYDAGLLEYAGFTCGADLGVFTPDSCTFLDSVGVPFDASDLNLPSIGVGELAGSQTVVRTVTSVADKTVRFRAKVDAPAGYDVIVSPARIKLAPGESATFEVTITNDGSGAANVWSHGSLTWKGGGYEVYSPIAVQGALFDAPPSITGAGTAGSASFDVLFGYAGAYSAAAHGLAGEVVTTDTVEQDPDQTFDPNDGYSNVHDFDLTGVSHFRLALPPGSTEDEADLDVFVFDPAGNQVATSTAGGTNELIELVAPSPGVWSVYIHGWATIGPDSDYDLSTWSVPDTAGSLSITAAPTAAVIGNIDTIDVAWTGLSAGVEYLGAVAHSDGAGVIGFTLVEVSG